MAANEYSDTSSNPQRTRVDAPLPPLPNPYPSYNLNSQQYKASPISSPFDDPSYRPHGRQSSQSLASNSGYYDAGGGGRDHDPGTYSDDIPLRPQQRKSSSDLLNPNNGPSDSDVHRPSLGPRKKSRTGATRRKNKKGLWSGRIPFVVYFFTTVQIVVFIAELIKAGVLTKSPIEIHPQFNPMIGPSPYVLINMGARYVPCMRNTTEIKNVTSLPWPCPNTTSLDLNDSSNQCTLAELCGFGDKKSQPRQWYRFIIPMFLHAGIIHISFNLLLQLTLGREMEQEIGPLRFALVYLSSGIFGFVLGGNFAPKGIASTGASGSLFGVIALMLLDLLYYWDERRSPWTDLFWIFVDIAVSFVLGLLPGLDNFSHIGGFLMGLVLGVCVLRSPNSLRQRIGLDESSYARITSSRKADNSQKGGVQGFVQQPVEFFKGRKPLWWAWWLVRVAALIGVLAGFIALIQNFRKANPTQCSWCKYLSCLPVKNWCDIGNLQITNQTTNHSKRELFSEMASFTDLGRFF